MKVKKSFKSIFVILFMFLVSSIAVAIAYAMPLESTANQTLDTYQVTFDYNYGNEDKKEIFSVSSGDYIKRINVPSRNGYYFLAWYENKDEINLNNAFDFETTPINRDITLYAFWLDYANDDDGDRLLNGEEISRGTDINKIDTDDDGLTDYEEIYLTLTDPLNAYSVLRNVKDSDIDIDLDGLTHREEIDFTSSPLWNDTDKTVYMTVKKESIILTLIM